MATPVGYKSQRHSREDQMEYQSINFGAKLKLFDEQWQPKVIAEMNDYQFKIVKLEGDFIWHDHKDTDETFIVLDGVLRIDFRDGAVHCQFLRQHAHACGGVDDIAPRIRAFSSQ